MVAEDHSIDCLMKFSTTEKNEIGILHTTRDVIAVHILYGSEIIIPFGTFHDYVYDYKRLIRAYFLPK